MELNSILKKTNELEKHVQEQNMPSNINAIENWRTHLKTSTNNNLKALNTNWHLPHHLRTWKQSWHSDPQGFLAPVTLEALVLAQFRNCRSSGSLSRSSVCVSCSQESQNWGSNAFQRHTGDFLAFGLDPAGLSEDPGFTCCDHLGAIAENQPEHSDSLLALLGQLFSVSN